MIKGVLRDGKENTANPTTNNIVFIPAVQTNYYRLMSEEQFIEKDINWLRLRDIELNYAFAEWIPRLPERERIRQGHRPVAENQLLRVGSNR